MTKVLHIITRLDRGGSAIETLIACQKLVDKYEVVLVHGLSLESNMTDSEMKVVKVDIEKARESGVKIIPISHLVRRIHPINDICALYDLIKIIHKEEPVIVHTHTSKAGILGRLAAKILNTPFIVHTPHGHVFYGHFGKLRSHIFLWTEKLFSSFTHRLVALTGGELDDYIRLAVCSAGKLEKIHSGVDIAKFKTVQIDTVEKKRRLGLSQNGAVVGFIGWLLPIKGPMHLLKAMEVVWQDWPDVQLVFIGKGDLDIDLRTAALDGSGNGRVKFLGWRDDVDEIIPVFDILVLPSLNEGMGRVLVEAMAAGKPLVASNVGGIPDLVRHNVNGLLVPPADEKALASAIMQLIGEPEKAQLMGRRGQEFCEEFSIEKMIEKIDNLYQELLKSHHPLQDSHCELRTDKVPENQITYREKSQPSDQDVKINT